MRAFLMCVMLVLSIPALSRATEPPASIEGDWAGALTVPGARLTLVLHVTRAGDAWSGTMDSVDQGAKGIPVDLITFDGKTLHFEMKAIGGSYDGEIAADGNSFAGTWQQSGQKLPLDLARTADAANLVPKRPQEPKPPLPYDEEEVTYPNPEAGITLAGTLSLPRTPGPHAAVLLITGSGPQDRDEFVLGHRPFLVLADHLVRAGIAVLRVDDRGIGKSTGAYPGATIADFTGDARAGVAFLKTRREIDAKRIGLVGHSEGGVVAPMVAEKSADVAFVVLLAGAGVKADELLARQSELIMRALGSSEAVIAANGEAQRKMFAIVQEDPDPASAEVKLNAVGDELMAKFAAIDSAMTEATAAQIKGSTAMVNSPWFRQFLAIDPAAALRKTKVPVLAINGSLDLQVDPKQNLPAIEKALRDGGNQDVTVRELPGLNHLFQTATTGSPAEYATIEETMSPVALNLVSEWIVARTKPAKR